MLMKTIFMQLLFPESLSLLKMSSVTETQVASLMTHATMIDSVSCPQEYQPACKEHQDKVELRKTKLITTQMLTIGVYQLQLGLRIEHESQETKVSNISECNTQDTRLNYATPPIYYTRCDCCHTTSQSRTS